jgi:hypothetical protein
MCCKGKQDGCQKPENLTGEAKDCSSEQICACHGEAGDHPCHNTGGCEHPERLQGEPGDCSPEQVRQCHGEGQGHSCQGS